MSKVQILKRGLYYFFMLAFAGGGLSGCFYDCGCEPIPDEDPKFSDVFKSEVVAIESTSINGFPQHPMRYADALTNANVQFDAENKKMYLRFSINGEYYKLAYDIGDPKYPRE